MAEYILLMHSDSARAEKMEDWGPYLEDLGKRGALRGGSAIGAGVSVRSDGIAAPLSVHLSGFVRVEARDLEEARQMLVGNPVYEAGGTVEIRELPLTG